MTIAQQRIADTINQFYDESAALAGCGLRYTEAANTLDEEVRTALVILLISRDLVYSIDHLPDR